MSVTISPTPLIFAGLLFTKNGTSLPISRIYVDLKVSLNHTDLIKKFIKPPAFELPPPSPLHCMEYFFYINIKLLSNSGFFSH